MSDYEEEFSPDEEEFEELTAMSVDEEDDEENEENDLSSSATSIQEDEEEEEDGSPPAKKRKVSSSKEKATKKGTSTRGRKTATKSDSKKKPAKAKATGTRDVDEARQYVEDFLLETNRPWSIINLTESLKGKAGKAVITKALSILAKKNLITEKAAGKQKVFWINQDNLEVLDDDSLRELESGIKESEKQYIELKENTASLERELNRYKNAPSIEKLDSDIVKLKNSIEAKRKKLESLSSTTLITPEEKQELTKNFDIYFKAWKERRRWCMDVLDLWCGDSVSMEDLKGKGLEIETDEDVGISLKDMIAKSSRYY